MAETQIAATFPGLKVLVVEDLLALAIQYKSIVARLDVDVTVAGTVALAKRRIAEGPWHAALIDLNLPDGSGFEVMQALLAANPACSVVVITAEDSLDVAVRASQAGAFDFIQKPVEAERLLVTLRNALNASRLNQRVASLQTGAPKQFEQFIGQSLEMQAVYKMIETVASSNASVCITGESGTGKELAAAAIHARSPRKAKKLVAINCAAIPKELIESELFGHARGAFTGAVTDRQGVFIEADKGTLFLDEIAELDLGVQAKLLRVLQTGEVKRLGEDKTRIVDVRIVCATHRNLAGRMRAGEFREDLFYRLFVVPIDLPPLRTRGDDIALIARDILARYALEDGKRFTDFSPEALAALGSYAWPGNVRELLNVIRAVVALNDAELVEWQMLPASLKTAPVEAKPWFSLPDSPAVATANPAKAASTVRASPKPLKLITNAKTGFDARQIRPWADVERDTVDYALRAFGGNVAKAARALQVNPSTLYRKIQGWADDGVDMMAPVASGS
jgi:two-component system, repressor protein LuxO